MRHYTWLVMRHGCHFEFWPPRQCTSPRARIRVVAAVMFKKYFGSAPDRPSRCWHKDGFMAECADRKGNVLQVEQTNYPRERHVTPPRYRHRTALAIIARKEAA